MTHSHAHQGSPPAGSLRRLYGVVTLLVAPFVIPLNALAFHPDQAKQTTTKVFANTVNNVAASTDFAATDNTNLAAPADVALVAVAVNNGAPLINLKGGVVANTSTELVAKVVVNADFAAVTMCDGLKGGVVADSATELATTVVSTGTTALRSTASTAPPARSFDG